MTALRAVAPTVGRVTVTCCKCNAVASVLTCNLAAYQMDHWLRCPKEIQRPMSIAESEAKRAADSKGANGIPFTLVDGDRAERAAPSHPAPDDCL